MFLGCLAAKSFRYWQDGVGDIGLNTISSDTTHPIRSLRIKKEKKKELKKRVGHVSLLYDRSIF